MNIFTLRVVFVALAVAFFAAAPSSLRAAEEDKASLAAPKEESSAEVIASRLRKQGHRCDKAQTAERDFTHSRADQAAWLLTCNNARYRITFVPHRAARIEHVGSR